MSCRSIAISSTKTPTRNAHRRRPQDVIQYTEDVVVVVDDDSVVVGW